MIHRRAATLALAGAVGLALAAGCAPREERAAGPPYFESSRGEPGDPDSGYAVYRVDWPDPGEVPGSSPLAESLRVAIAWSPLWAGTAQRRIDSSRRTISRANSMNAWAPLEAGSNTTPGCP